MMFSESGNDLLRYLKVYCEYVKLAESDRSNWCRSNCILESHMSKIVELVKSVISAVSRQYPDIPKNLLCRTAEYQNDHTQQLINHIFCETFKHNIAIYSGIGYKNICVYKNIKTAKLIKVHPSSALQQLDVSPEFIVYEYSKCKNNTYDFAYNIVSADLAWVRTIVDEEKLRDVEDRKLRPFNVMMGPTAKNLVRKNIIQIQKEIALECRTSEDLEYDPCHRLQLFITRDHFKNLQHFIKKNIQPTVDYLNNETFEFPVSNADYRIHIGPGWVPIELLLPGEYCSVFAGKDKGYFNWDVNPDFLNDELYPHFEQYGKITAVIKFDERRQKYTGCACLIRFENKHVAKEVIDAHLNDTKWGISVKPEVRTEACDFQQFSIKIRWFRRRSLGHGYVKVSNVTNEQMRRIANRITEMYRDLQLRLRFKEPNSIFNPKGLSKWERDPHEIAFYRLDETINAEQLYNMIAPHFSEENVDIRQNDVTVVFDESSSEEDSGKLHEYKDQICSYLKQIGEESQILPFNATGLDEPSTSRSGSNDFHSLPFEVEVEPVKHATDVEMFASVHFRNFETSRRFMDAIQRFSNEHSQLILGHKYPNPARFQSQYKIGFEISECLFNCLYDEFSELKEHLIAHSPSIALKYFVAQTEQRNRIVIADIGSDFEKVRKEKEKLEELIEGIKLDCRDPNERHRAGEQSDLKLPYHKLLNSDEREWLSKYIPKDVIMTVLPLKKQIKLQGAYRQRTKAKRLIDEYLKERMSASIERRIPVRPPYYHSGTMKALLRNAGSDMDLRAIAAKLGDEVHLGVQFRQILLFKGRESEYDRLLEWLRNLSDGLSKSEENDRGGEDVPKCAICMSTASAETYCMESCGHYACIECLNNQINSAINNLDFPITCVVCGLPYSMKDFRKLIMDGHTDDQAEDLINMKALVDSAVTFFMNHNADKYRYCVTPSCMGIHEVTSVPKLYSCSQCGRKVCTHCGNEEHGSVNCDDYARLRGNVDESVNEWLKNDPAHRKRCPNESCGAVIEKQAGCNHMQCEKCQIHFCWLCQFSSKESGPIYAHLQNTHGGLGVGLVELLAEIDDPVMAEIVLAQLEDDNAVIQQEDGRVFAELDDVSSDDETDEWDDDGMWDVDDMLLHHE